MICDLYLNMGDIDRLEFDTKLLHIAHHSDYYMKVALSMIMQGEKEGLLDNVKIGREIHEAPTLLAYTEKNHNEKDKETN